MDKRLRLQTLANDWSTCRACSLLCDGRKHVVFGHGQFEKVPIMDQGEQVGFGGQILVVGEAPGAQEDELGVPFVGKSGTLLNTYLASTSGRPEVKEALKDLNDASDGSDKFARHEERLRQLLLQEFFFTNVVCCRPPDNRDPTPKEVAACRPRLMETLYLVDPVVIIAVGRIAVEALIGRKVSITQVRGELFDVPVQGRLLKPFKYPMIATLHPSYLLRKNDFKQKGGEMEKTYHDIRRAMELVDDFNFQNFKIRHPNRD